MTRRPILAALLASLAALAQAQGSSLSSVPAATTIGENRLAIQYRQTSRDQALDSRYRKNLQIVYGPASWAEIAFDSDLDGQERLGAKLNVAKGPQGFLATIGAQDLLGDPQLFAVAKVDLQGNQLHAGLLDLEDPEPYIGLRRMANEQLRLTADHLFGPTGRTSLRADYNLTENWRATVRLYFPNETTNPRTHRFEITYRLTLQ